MKPSGAEQFARYAYPPNELGYCGPDDASVLLARESERDVAQSARQFEGAWPYLEIIAAAAGIRDPLDPRVVEAYWIGNELLDTVRPESLMTELQQRFPGQSGASWVPGLAHHSYHVFAVYPWVGLLRQGRGTDVALSVLQQCRIRWGEVVAVHDERVTVASQPLELHEGVLVLGAAREEEASWSVAGRSLLASVAVGDQVALHWDWVCDVLSDEQVRALAQRSADQLARTNAGAP